MTNQNDPIAQIKKAEEESKQKIEAAKKKFDEELGKFSEELAKKTEDFEKTLKERGLEKLNNVKKEAGELFKSKMSTAESEKNKVTADAKGKQEEAVKEIVNKFLESAKISQN